MKFRFLTLSALFLCLNTFAQKVSQNANYQFFVDLTKVQNDKLEVSLITPKFSKDEVVYNMPKIVPERMPTMILDDMCLILRHLMLLEKHFLWTN
jgi:hypothetical protein